MQVTVHQQWHTHTYTQHSTAQHRWKVCIPYDFNAVCLQAAAHTHIHTRHSTGGRQVRVICDFSAMCASDCASATGHTHTHTYIHTHAHTRGTEQGSGDSTGGRCAYLVILTLCVCK